MAEDSRGKAPDTGRERPVFLEGYLLKRSETLRRWNQRWFTLDPTTARMEYRQQRGDPYPRGLIVFDERSTLTLSPMNFHGAKQYEGCCLYVGTPRKKEYFLVAETPAAARAWIAVLRATMHVLKAHREAVDTIALGGKAYLRRSGAVASAAKAANGVAASVMPEVVAANQKAVVTHGVGGMRASMHAAATAAAIGGERSEQGAVEEEGGVMDERMVMKETMRVKDEELQQMAGDLRARDATIREMADRLSETADAAEAAAAAAMQMDADRKAAVEEAERARTRADERVTEAEAIIREMEEKYKAKRAHLQQREVAALRSRDEAVAEVGRWRNQAEQLQQTVAALELRLKQTFAAAAADGAPDGTAQPGRDRDEEQALKAKTGPAGNDINKGHLDAPVDDAVSVVQNGQEKETQASPSAQPQQTGDAGERVEPGEPKSGSHV